MSSSSTAKTWSQLGVSDWLARNLRALNITEPSKIQREAIPAIFTYKSDGRTRKDVFACARTGSGKTLAYVLPILEILVRDPRPYFALILAPTRELAYQINEMIKILTGSTTAGGALTIKSLLVIGGGNYGDGVNKDEARGLWFGKPNIVVATPGRFWDQLENRNQIEFCGTLKSLSFDMLVLDEADQLISPTFSPQIKGILNWLDKNELTYLNGETPFKQKKRQTLVLSATLTEALEQLQEVIKKRDPSNQPVIINQLPSTQKKLEHLRTNPNLDQRYILCPANVKYAYLVECLLDLSFRQLIIFCGSKYEARLVHRILLSLGFSGKEFNLNPVLLNSGMKQKLRFAALDMFKALKSRILVTTDLANRGLDIPQVDLVINLDCPKIPINYVHRVGRTCREPEFDSKESTSPTTSSGVGVDKDSTNHEEKHSAIEGGEKSDVPNDEGVMKGIEKVTHSSSANMREENSSKNEPTKKKKKKFQGKSVTFVSQFDIRLIQTIEEFIGLKLQKEDGLDEDNIVSILKQVGLAKKEAELNIEYEDQEGKLSNDKSRKRPRNQTTSSNLSSKASLHVKRRKK